MASPIAHSIAGLSFGIACFLPPSNGVRAGLENAWRLWKPLLACVFLACAPDLDYIPGLCLGDFNMFHQQYSHSIGWVALLALAAWLIARARDPAAGFRMMAFLFALTASHLAIDLLTSDASIPQGIMVAWPVSDRYVFLPFHFFPNMAKQDWSEVLNLRNFMVVGVEFVMTMPVLLAVLAWKRKW